MAAIKIKQRILIIALALCCVRLGLAEGSEHWVTTWGCGAQLTEPRNLPPAQLAGGTLRQFVHVTIGGKRLRVRFSNAYGDGPVTLNSAHVALADDAGSGGSGGINPGTDKELLFKGAPAITLPAGETAQSDPLDFDLPALGNLAITIFFGAVPAATVTGHPGSRTTSFITAGDAVGASSMPEASKTQHWYIITGVDVLADPSRRAVVILGDSIADGRGSDTDRNDRWPDDLAGRLAGNPATAGVAVVNMGIGGNGIFGGLGPSAMKRFDRDALDQDGVRWLIVFEGVNDIGNSHSGGIATNLIAAYIEFANKAHARKMAAYGGTITPFGKSFYFSPAHEAARQTVNAWFRTNNVYDGVIDFDAAVRDPVAFTNLLPAYNSGDWLHLSPAGYRAMADAINLTLFTQ